MVRFVVIVAFFLAGCSRTDPTLPELSRMQKEIHGLTMLAETGMTEQEYSQRLGDMLLRVGDWQNIDPRSDVNIVQHIVTAIEAYKEAKNYFGPYLSTIEEKELVELEVFRRFPRLPGLMEPYEPGTYFRSGVVRGLWTIGAEEEALGAKLIAEKSGE